MADVIRIKRRTGGAAGAPASLANAELAYNETDHTLYIGEGTGGAGGSATVITPIGGSGLGSSSLPVVNGTASAGSSSSVFARGSYSSDRYVACAAKLTDVYRDSRCTDSDARNEYDAACDHGVRRGCGLGRDRRGCIVQRAYRYGHATSI